MSGRSFLSRRLARNGSSGEPATDPKGPLGLNTLYEPHEPAVADLVFVHGLGGGSRSTWTKSADPSLYWIQEWLPNDPGFRDVRIHSFGYNSDWDKVSILNLHDFAKSLLGSIQDCPSIPRNSAVSVQPRHFFVLTYFLMLLEVLFMGFPDTPNFRWPQYGRTSDQACIYPGQAKGGLPITC